MLALVGVVVAATLVWLPGAASADELIEPQIILSAPDPFLSPGVATAHAKLSGGALGMTGQLVLALYSPGSLKCGATPVATASQAVASGEVSVTLSRTFRRGDPEGLWYWQASYAGDAEHTPATSACRPMFVVEQDPWSEGPFGSVENLVLRQYHDLLDRDPSAAEMADWAGRIRDELATPGDLVAALRVSDDHRVHVDPVVRLYRAYFLRTPDVGGMKYWIGQSRSGRSLQSISEFFSRSTEFQNRYGALSNAAFVDLVYQNVLGRGGDQGGVSYWNGQLDSGARDRGSVMVGFSESPEYVAAQASEVTVSVLFGLMMGRMPGPLEFTTFVELLDVGPTAPLPYTVVNLVNDILARSDYPT
jgi:hypothetical protein